MIDNKLFIFNQFSLHLSRNCLVGHNKVVKISDYGMSRATYKNDYYRSPAGCLLPIRWMAWESVILVSNHLSFLLENRKSFY